MTDGTDGDGVVHHYRGLIHGADAHDGDLRLIDYGGADQAAEAAEIGDGEGAAYHFIGLQLTRTGARGQIHDGALQAEHVLLVGAANYRNDEAVLQRNGDADI